MPLREMLAACVGLLSAVSCCVHAAENTPVQDVVAPFLVASPHRITEQAADRKLRFVLSRADGKPVLIVATAEQSFERVDGKTVVTVCKECGDEPAATAQQTSDFLLPNPWVQSQDPFIRKLAARAGRPDESVDRRMKRLIRIVERRLEGVIDDVDYADAVKAFDDGRGDCTEFALALTALARAQGIPARVVFGMAYSSRFTRRKNVFTPHVWTQVWDRGKWVSYDAALGRFDSTHIALTIGSGDPPDAIKAFRQFPQLKIEQVGLVVR